MTKQLDTKDVVEMFRRWQAEAQELGVRVCVMELPPKTDDLPLKLHPGSLQRLAMALGKRYAVLEVPVPEDHTDEGWAWMAAGSLNAHGPFDTREQAIAHARESLDPGPGEQVDIHVEPVARLRFEDWTPDPTWLLELASDNFTDNEGVDDAGFHLVVDGKDSLKQAGKELDLLLAAWGSRWVTADPTWYIPEGEPVTLEGGKDEQ